MGHDSPTGGHVLQAKPSLLAHLQIYFTGRMVPMQRHKSPVLEVDFQLDLQHEASMGSAWQLHSLLMMIAFIFKGTTL